MAKKGSGIFRGNKELTASEVKSFIMQQRGWTSQEYQKEYDKLRNRVRNLESYQRAQGVRVTKQYVSATFGPHISRICDNIQQRATLVQSAPKATFIIHFSSTSVPVLTKCTAPVSSDSS